MTTSTRPLTQLQQPGPISISGLGPEDLERIRKWGFTRWWNWACDAQERRLAKNGAR